MSDHFPRSLVWTGAATLVLAWSVGLGAQNQAEFANNLKFDSGQDIQPVFDGWARNPDGSFDLYFGYLNRNWVQKVQVPVGPNNHIQPGGPDRGQPTYFYTRTNRKVFTVNVPKDFGHGELLWTLNVNGRPSENHVPSKGTSSSGTPDPGRQTSGSGGSCSMT